MGYADSFIKRVLVTKSNSAAVAKDKELNQLARGQIGVFSNVTGLSIDESSAIRDMREFFFAVGIDPAGTGSVTDVRKSQVIKRENINGYNVRCYTKARNAKWNITMTSANCELCDEDYILKFDINDADAWFNYGYNPFLKSFVWTPDCCGDCTNCTENDCLQVAKNIRDAINADDEGLFTAVALDPLDELVLDPVALTDAQIDGLRSAQSPSVGTLTLAVNILNTETVSIGGTDYTFQDTLTDVDGNVHIGATIQETLENFIAALTLGDGAGVKYAASMSAQTDVDVRLGSATTLIVTSQNKDGDDTITTTETIADVGSVWGAATLENGGATRATACPVIRIDTNTKALQTYCGIPNTYHFPRGIGLTISATGAFECCGTVASLQDLLFEEGAGGDIRELEYEAGGQSGAGPYALTESGVDLRSDFSFIADASDKYLAIDILFDAETRFGGQVYMFPNVVTLAIPAGETTTTADLVAIIDDIVGTDKDTPFASLASYIAACDNENTANASTSGSIG